MSYGLNYLRLCYFSFQRETSLFLECGWQTHTLFYREVSLCLGLKPFLFHQLSWWFFFTQVLKKNTEDSLPKMGKILGVFCLTGLRFFLGVFFLGEEQLYILLCVFFIPAFHPVPCGTSDRQLSFEKAVRSIRYPVLLPLATFSNSLRQKRLLPPCVA